MKAKIVIITNGNYFARLILERVIRRYSDSICGFLIVTGDYKGRTRLHTLWELAKSTATPYLVYKVFTHLVFESAQCLFPHAILSVERQAQEVERPICKSVSVNSEAARSWVASLEPDLLVSVSCPQLIGREMLSMAKLGGINIHSSLLPTYAGLAPYYWVLSAGERNTGTTVHYMTLRFDAGNVLVQRQVVIEPGESAFHLFKRLAQLGSEALEEAVLMTLEGVGGIEQDLERYTYYSHPTFKSYLDLRRHGHVLVRAGELIETVRSGVSDRH